MLSKNKLLLLNIKNKETLNAYIFMAPTILILGVFLLLPILLAVVLAFHKVQPLGEISYNFRGWKKFFRIQMTNGFGLC
jgi:multiple sugar transport system permease protein